MKKSSGFKYIKSFDGLRGIAALAVLLLHGSYGFVKGGWIGVDIFFVLSGFLITSLLKEEFRLTGKISISNFYMRRLLRLLPPLIVCIFISNILWSYTELYVGANLKMASLGAMFYFTNLMNGAVSGNMAHLWSLAVEEHFYLIWPIIASFFLFKASKKSINLFFILALLGVILLRIIIYNFSENLEGAIFSISPERFTFCKIDTILMGSALAFYKPNFLFKENLTSNPIVNSIIILFFFIVLFGICLFVGEDGLIFSNGGFILTGLFSISIVYIAIINEQHIFFTNRVLTWFGKRSYGIYVYHLPIFLALESFRLPSDYINLLWVTLLRFVLSIILAAISYKYLELPILSFKKRFKNSKKTQIFK
jgi:peptidoglycan/LPS O-acetylase OafA/YrhL